MATAPVAANAHVCLPTPVVTPYQYAEGERRREKHYVIRPSSISPPYANGKEEKVSIRFWLHRIVEPVRLVSFVAADCLELSTFTSLTALPGHSYIRSV